MISHDILYPCTWRWDLGKESIGMRATLDLLLLLDLPHVYAILGHMGMPHNDIELILVILRRPYKPCPSDSRIDSKEFWMVSGSVNGSGENPPPVTIHTRFERFNKQNPHSFDNAAAPKDAENRISQLEEILMFSRQGPGGLR
ncbi:hypothetical protein Tco_0578033 [Tanacetum coccineum]